MFPIDAQQIGAGEGGGAMSWHSAIVPRERANQGWHPPRRPGHDR
ncbi:hypothetical protein SSKA14_1523 [Stenotrophomonas sp. SKA14]|nr:hypothetical protein SSKA14_1523 [Stenotrophomonas sp. SKA14]